MSITTGVCARIGPWPSSCGSTAWSPGAQMVCAGTQPSAMMRVLTARAQVLGREPAAVAAQPAVPPDAAAAQRLDAGRRVRPPRRAAPPRSRAPRRAASPRARGQNGSGAEVEPHAARVAAPRPGPAGSGAAPRRCRTRSCAQRRARSPPAARRLAPARCARGARDPRPGQDASTRGLLLARGPSRGRSSPARALAPRWTKRNGSGAKKPVG